jgi:hypothetical protein
MWGLTVEEAAGPPVEVWPDNWSTVQVFAAMETQWRIGMSGPAGLDYGVLPNVMRMTGVPRKEWPIVFDGIRIMEGAALDKMREKK